MDKTVSIFSRVVILLVVFFAGYYAGTEWYADSSGACAAEIAGDGVGSASLMIDYGVSGEIEAHGYIEFEEGDSVFDVVETAAEREGLELVYEDYGGDLGVLLTSVNGVGGENVSGAYWQYWVNNEYGQVGMSSYEVSDGDVLFLKFTATNPAK